MGGRLNLSQQTRRSGTLMSRRVWADHERPAETPAEQRVRVIEDWRATAWNAGATAQQQATQEDYARPQQTVRPQVSAVYRVST